MRTAEEWFEDYGVSHQNPTNKKIHWVCVPLIFFSTNGLFWAIPHGYFGHEWVNWATIIVTLGLLFYLRLSFTLFLGMAALSGLSLWGNYLIAQSGAATLAIVSATIFILAWIGQFIGHIIEGMKPSFFKDLQFLLIGPAWVINFLYKKLNIPI